MGAGTSLQIVMDSVQVAWGKKTELAYVAAGHGGSCRVAATASPQAPRPRPEYGQIEIRRSRARKSGPDLCSF